MHVVAARWQVKNPGHSEAQLAEPTAVIKKRIKAINYITIIAHSKISFNRIC
jgi:hypothetical protein